MIETSSRFPAGFVWGVATSAYQIEGATAEDGRGESIWDRFAATPGAVQNGDTAAVADDHYHRYREDVALMHDLNVRAYRFSVAWPRVLPEGRGAVNEAGLDFYDRLVDELLARGIEPYLTLYHWDLPQALEDRGGWKSRETAQAFAEYAAICARRLGDRVRHWITHNEPWCVSWSGYGSGKDAPGLAEGAAGAIPVAHHLLLSHGLAVDAVRQYAPNARAGITLNLYPIYTLDDSESVAVAARHRDGIDNRWFLDPVFRGQYPEDMQDLQAHLPEGAQQDLATIAAPIDFLGVNYYHRHVIGADDQGRPIPLRPENVKRTGMGWEEYPQGLYTLLTRLQHEYSPASMYVTENGAAYPDVREPDGTIQDSRRQLYVEQHLAAALRAIQAGVPLHGYFLWSLLDNFEWSHGFSKRFGIVYVDYQTLERIPKQSAYWYRDFIAQQTSESDVEAVG